MIGEISSMEKGKKYLKIAKSGPESVLLDAERKKKVLEEGLRSKGGGKTAC